MSVLTAVYAKTVADATITAIIGTRCYPDVAPTSSALPYVVIQQITKTHEHNMTAATGIARTHLQVDVYGATRSATETLADAIRTEWDGYRGTTGSVVMRSAIIESERDAWDWIGAGNEDVTHRTVMELYVWHAETVPTFP